MTSSLRAVFVLALTLVVGCSSVSYTAPLRPLPPRGPGCPLDVVIHGRRNGTHFVWARDYDVIVVVSSTTIAELTPERLAEVKDHACKVGGDTVVTDQDGGAVILHKYTEQELAARLAVELQLYGVSDDKLRLRASFDHGCAIERVRLITKREDLGSGEYVLDVCGSERRYIRTGSVFAPAPVASPAPAAPAAAPAT